MNIIMLSGGSGKRLWPLSNEIRSKQFLKVLKNEKGLSESMLQRVYRQIKQAGFKTNIVVATGEAQIEAIKEQIGEGVHIVAEPERRNTFPAIALSCAYMAFKEKIPYEAPVIVLPVDPYVEEDYFYRLKMIEQAVEGNLADLVLMGIKPTYPSAKYGYIMPEKDTAHKIEAGITFQRVKKFIEKPDEAVAQKWIAEGAFWNGGVFAFKLGYLMRLIEDALSSHSYSFEAVREHYGKLSKNSFDYEVVEKASSVGVIPYEGMWKDLGTWNTLTDEMTEDYSGDVITGEGTKNTKIINELSIPMVVLGANDMVVAASPDGILVSNRQKSSYIKPYVENVGERPMYEEHAWGEYKVLDYMQYHDGMRSLTKHLTIQAGKEIAYQSHGLRDEIWVIVDGTACLNVDGHTRNVRRGDVAYIIKGERHGLKAVSEVHLIEVQIGEELTEEDADLE